MFRPGFRRKVALVIIFGMFLVGFTLVGVEAMRENPNAVIEVVAENLAFKGNNPTLFAEPGSEVKLIFRNEARGIEHNFVIEGLGVETAVLRPGEREEINFSVPMRDTVLTYSCYLHPIMKGQFVVGDPSEAMLMRMSAASTREVKSSLVNWAP